jgi:Tol biopolymer transport system component
MTLAGVAVADGAFRIITPQRWTEIGRIVWFGDGSGMAVSAKESAAGNWQIWQVSYPEGSARRITNDLHSYGAFSLTLTADSRTLVALQTEATAGLWVAPDGDARRARALTSPQNAEDGAGGVDWTPDGRIVFTSTVGGAHRIWVMKADGSERRPLTGTADDVGTPQVSPDGRHIFYEARTKTPA